MVHPVDPGLWKQNLEEQKPESGMHYANTLLQCLKKQVELAKLCSWFEWEPCIFKISFKIKLVLQAFLI